MYIESLLKDDEEIYHVYECINDDVLGALAHTDTRLIFGTDGIWTGESIEEIDYEKIGSVELKNNFSGSILSIYVKNSQQVMEIKSGSRENLSKSRSLIADKIEEYNNDKELISEGKTNYFIADELLKLVKLKEDGHLSAAEFELIKTKLINQ